MAVKELTYMRPTEIKYLRLEDGIYLLDDLDRSMSIKEWEGIMQRVFDNERISFHAATFFLVHMYMKLPPRPLSPSGFIVSKVDARFVDGRISIDSLTSAVPYPEEVSQAFREEFEAVAFRFQD